ncbi:MAG: NYN domain-containing protein [Christensenellaceae bacterium]
MAGILIVDGYNILHSWGHLNQAIAKIGLDGARDRLIAELEDYAGTTHTQVIVVFDAYHTQRMLLTQQQRNGVEVVFTRHKETADHYIERLVSTLDTRQYDVRVATSDGVEQVVVMGRGASRISARELEIDVKNARRERNTRMERQHHAKRHTLETLIDPETLRRLRDSLPKED